MRAAYASRIDPDDPLAGLVIGDLPEPATPEDWTTVRVTASALNHHDLWSLRGVGLAEDQLPMILGCDAAGVDEAGNEVIVHAVIGDPSHGDETLDPKRSLLSERWPGAIADTVRVPRRNLVSKPPELTFAQAACLPTAWLTAYRMLRVRGRLPENGAVLVQGAGGGVATAAVVLAGKMGARVYATSRDATKREKIAALGAIPIEPGARLPERVDVVIETVGEATFDHSLKSTKPGGRIVVCGSTSGPTPRVDLRRVFFLQLEIIGSTMGTRDELGTIASLCVSDGIRPVIDSTFAFSDARSAFERLADGDVFGKIVIDHTR
jgi:NADPH:quinone reductase-like Zn-dependent oxidoreductase